MRLMKGTMSAALWEFRSLPQSQSRNTRKGKDKLYFSFEVYCLACTDCDHHLSVVYFLGQVGGAVSRHLWMIDSHCAVFVFVAVLRKNVCHRISCVTERGGKYQVGEWMSFVSVISSVVYWISDQKLSPKNRCLRCYLTDILNESAQNHTLSSCLGRSIIFAFIQNLLCHCCCNGWV